MPALTCWVSANFALANFLASRSVGNVSVALGCRRFAHGRSNETYQVPRDLLAMRPPRGLGPQRTILCSLVAFRSGLRALLLVTTENSHHPYPRQHRRAAFRRHQDQGLHRGLPLRRLVLCLGHLCDVGPGILERDELAAAGQRDWLVERAPSTRVRHLGRAAFEPSQRPVERHSFPELTCGAAP